MLVHGTWMKNLKSILSEGLRPGGGQNKGRLRHEDSDGGVVHAVRSRSKAAEAHDHGSKYAEAWGRPPEVKLYIDPKRIDPAGLFSSNSRASGDDPDHFLIKGRIPASAIVHVEVNVPAEVPPQLRAGVGNPLNFQSVPVVSLGLPDGCFSGDTGGVPASSRKQEDLVREVGAACRGPGFLQIVDHGIAAAELRECFHQSARFFRCPAPTKAAINQKRSRGARGYFGKAEENLDILGAIEGEATAETTKLQKRTDNKEGLDMGNDLIPIDDESFGAENQLPPESELPGFRRWACRYHNVLVRLARHLLRLMARALGLPADFFDGLTTAPVSTLRLLHYWPISNFQKEIGCGAHTDYGLVTLLLQDDVGGLQVLNKLSGSWIHVPPIEGALVVNLGDMMARWTSSVFQSTIHRVVNTANVDRYSAPLFFNPNIDAKVVPVLKAAVKASAEKSDNRDSDLAASEEEESTCGDILKSFYREAGLL